LQARDFGDLFSSGKFWTSTFFCASVSAGDSIFTCDRLDFFPFSFSPIRFGEPPFLGNGAAHCPLPILRSVGARDRSEVNVFRGLRFFFLFFKRRTETFTPLFFLNGGNAGAGFPRATDGAFFLWGDNGPMVTFFDTREAPFLLFPRISIPRTEWRSFPFLEPVEVLAGKETFLGRFSPSPPLGLEKAAFSRQGLLHRSQSVSFGSRPRLLPCRLIYMFPFRTRWA